MGRPCCTRFRAAHLPLRGQALGSPGAENTTVDATATLGQTAVVTIPTARENEINSILEELTSRNLIVRVVDSVGPQAILGTAAPEASAASAIEPGGIPRAEPPDPTTIDDRYRAIVELTKVLKVEVIKRSNILVEVTATHRGRTPPRRSSPDCAISPWTAT